MFGKSFPNTLDFVLVRFILKILQTPRRRRRGGLRRSRRFGVVVVPQFSCRAKKVDVTSRGVFFAPGVV